MIWVTALGGVLRAGFGYFAARESGKRAERVEQLKMILAAERARTTPRNAVGWALVAVAGGLLVGDLYYTGGANTEVMLQVFAMALAQ